MEKAKQCFLETNHRGGGEEEAEGRPKHYLNETTGGRCGEGEEEAEDNYRAPSYRDLGWGCRAT